MDKFILLCLSTLLCGCHGYLTKTNYSAMPPISQQTIAGGEIELIDGEVYYSPAKDDIEAIFGASLVEEERGLRVTQLLHPESKLQLGDLITEVKPKFDSLSRRLVGEIFVPEISSPKLDQLKALVVASEWLQLRAIIERGGKKTDANLDLNRSKKLLTTERIRKDSGLYERFGVEAIDITNWPDSYKPIHGKITLPDEANYKVKSITLFSRVRWDSPAALAGLRPMDIQFAVEYKGEEGVALNDEILTAIFNAHEQSQWHDLLVVTPSGKRKKIEVKTEYASTNIWIPLLFSFEKDQLGTHFGIGPLDWLFHYSSEKIYDRATDSYNKGSRWSLAGLFFKHRHKSKHGQFGAAGVGIFDPSRIQYAILQSSKLRESSPRAKKSSNRAANMEVSVGLSASSK